MQTSILVAMTIIMVMFATTSIILMPQTNSVKDLVHLNKERNVVTVVEFELFFFFFRPGFLPSCELRSEVVVDAK